MNIKKTSWHYKLVKNFNGGSVPRELCSYIRWMIISVCVCAFIFAMACAAAIVFVWAPIHAIAGFFGWASPNPDQMRLGFGILGIEFVLGLAFGCIWWYRGYSERNQFTKPKEPGLIVSYYRAKKYKFCPTLNFV